MKIVSIIIASIGSLLVLYTMICGFWIHAHGASPEEVTYHGRYGISSIVLLVLGLALLVYQVLKS